MRRVALITGVWLLAASLYAAVNPVLTELGQAINAYNAHDYAGVVQRLKGKSIAGLGDYVAYYLGAAEQLNGDFDAAEAVLSAYREKREASSPLAGRISVLHARVLVDKKDPALAAKAVRILREDAKDLPQPEGEFALALALQAAGDNHGAALSFQKVYYSYPAADLAGDAATALGRLREAMGAEYPAPPVAQQLERCEKWLAARQYKKARAEYFQLAETLNGPDRDRARVGVGVADYQAGAQSVALRYLQEFQSSAPDAEAERLYYVVEAARRVVDDAAMTRAIEELNRNFAQSLWRMKALVSAGNRYFSTNDRARYSELYQLASAWFPDDAGTATPHWRLAWDAYVLNKPEKVALLSEQLERYPADGHASSALYYLGRVAESEGRAGEARAYYEALTLRFPHYFYTTMAKERKEPESAVAADKATRTWLDGLAWPKHRDLSDTQANTATQKRIDRERLLVEAGQPDLAEAEARFGARTGNEQPQLLALDLAKNEPTPFKALRVMKSLTADYLAVPTEAGSARFWQMLFPLPWKSDIERDAATHDLDPYHVAGLIRQESEFNPNAKSHANAYGLMQLLPATGKMLGRQQGIAVTRPIQLFNPSLNIQLGSRYLKAQLDTWSGDWYKTLAAYNAGPTRVREWTASAAFREPLEFVESIPFDETREYVQAVLRNADLYRELYTGKLAAALTPTPAPAKVAAAPAKAVVSKKMTPAPAKKPASVVKRPA